MPGFKIILLAGMFVSSPAVAEWQCESYSGRGPLPSGGYGRTCEEAEEASMGRCQAYGQVPENCQILCCHGKDGPGKPANSCLQLIK